MRTLIKGDCIIESQAISDNSVDLILTDLPFGVLTPIGEGAKHGLKGKIGWDIAIDPEKIFEIANRILKENGRLILFCQQPYTTQLINSVKPPLKFSYTMVWVKDHFANALIAKHSPVKLHEDIAVFKKTLGGTEGTVFNLWEGKKYKSDVLQYKKDYDGHHPTQKPVLLLEDLIQTYSNEGGLVVDLTMGSGSTGVACVKTRRGFTGIELNENYYKIACKRVSDASKSLEIRDKTVKLF